MSNHFPIPSPPDELVRQWTEATRYKKDMPYPEGYEQCEQRLCTAAARWGADMELEACLKWMGSFCATWTCGRRPEDVLRAGRRPKPPSLKEQALAVLDDCSHRLDSAHENTIRRALEQLND